MTRFHRRWARPRPVASPLSVLSVLGAALLGAALLATGCGPKEGTSDVTVPDGTPVVLISIDTLRSDHLPAYGYDGVETPAIDRLRRDGILYEHAFAHAPTTLPSHASIFTGRVPALHGVRDNMGYRLDPADGFYLPRSLKEAGYRTGAAVSAYVLRAETGLADGFDLYEDQIGGATDRGVGIAERPGSETLDRSLEWLNEVSNQPFFFFFHLYEPHAPYAPPESLEARYETSYDGEIAEADRVVGRLLDELRRLGVYDRALVILLSDHGEGLGDHGLDEHGLFLYREAIQVPLLVKLPEGQLAGRTAERAAQLIDVAPTLAQTLGLDGAEALPGGSLLDLLEPGGEERAIYAETYFPWVHYGWSPLQSIVRFPDHLIFGPDPELYDLAGDPEEMTDRLPGDRQTFAELRSELRPYPRELERPVSEDQETRDRLAALGYLGSARGATEGPLADPKTKLAVIDELKAAFDLYRDEDYDSAARAFHNVVGQDPGLLDAWEMLGRSLIELGHHRDAVGAFRELMERSGGAPEAALPMAEALVRLGRFDEALEYATIAGESEPRAATLLAQIAVAQDRLDDADRHLSFALEELGRRPALLLIRASILLGREQFDEALETLDEAERGAQEAEPPRLPRGLLRMRGEALASLGRPLEAADAFRKEIETFPDELQAYTRLAVLFAVVGDTQGTLGTLRAMTQLNPTPRAHLEAVRTLRILGDEQAASKLLAYARERWPQSPELGSPDGS